MLLPSAIQDYRLGTDTRERAFLGHPYPWLYLPLLLHFPLPHKRENLVLPVPLLGAFTARGAEALQA